MTTLLFVLRYGNNVHIIDEICGGLEHIHSLTFNVKFECLKEEDDGYLIGLAHDISKNDTFKNLKIDKLRICDPRLAFYLRRNLGNVKELVICSQYHFTVYEKNDMDKLGINFRYWKTNTKDKVYLKSKYDKISSLDDIKCININATTYSGFEPDQIKTFLSGNINKLTIKIDDDNNGILDVICNTSATRIKIIGRFITIDEVKRLVQMDGITELKLVKEQAICSYGDKNLNELEEILNWNHTITNLVLYMSRLTPEIKNILERNKQLLYNKRFICTKPIM